MTQKLDEKYGLLDLDDNFSTEEAHLLIDETLAKHRGSMDEAIAKHKSSIDEAIAKHRAFIDEAVAKHKAFIDEAVAKHTTSIRALEISILALKTQRNTFSPIIRHLSPEILYKIFYFVRNNNSEIFIGDDEGGPTQELNPLTWVNIVNVSHVSRYWRNVAIDWPSLWAHPPFSNLRWAEEMLRRSKEASLVIDLDDRWPESVEGFELALKPAHRIEHLSIYADANEWAGILPMLPKSTPQLQSLCLSSSYATRSPYDGSKFPKPIFGLEVIPSGSSKLCSLELNYFTVNWDSQSTLLHSLTYLKLHGAVPSADLTWTWLVDVLKGTPRLEVLDLKDSFPACPEEHVAYGSAHLGFLRELYVSCEPEEGGIFLSCITVPPTTNITIDCCVNLHDVLSTSAITFSNTFIGLAHLYSNMDPAPDFRTLTLLQPLLPLHGARLQLFVKALTHEPTPLHDARLLDITYTWPTCRSRYALEDVATNAANDLFSSGLPLGNISHVYRMEGIDGFGAETLARTVGELPQVRSVVTTKSIRRMLDDALRLGLDLADSEEDSETENYYEDEDDDDDEEEGEWDDSSEDEDGDDGEDDSEDKESNNFNYYLQYM